MTGARPRTRKITAQAVFCTGPHEPSPCWPRTIVSAPRLYQSRSPKYLCPDATPTRSMLYHVYMLIGSFVARSLIHLIPISRAGSVTLPLQLSPFIPCRYSCVMYSVATPAVVIDRLGGWFWSSSLLPNTYSHEPSWFCRSRHPPSNAVHTCVGTSQPAKARPQNPS